MVDPKNDCIDFGKHKGLPYYEAPSEYLHWMLENFTKDDAWQLARTNAAREVLFARGELNSSTDFALPKEKPQ